MDRTELDQLDRETLIERAEALNIPRARILTRPELIDDILAASARASVVPPSRGARGFFGRARDLLARVVEQGLHLPDAAERIRAAVFEPIPARVPPAAMPTVTLAEIYAAQGHRDRAMETLQSVLAREPEHATARALLAKLEQATGNTIRPPLPPEDEEAPIVPVVSAAEAEAAEEQAAAAWDPRDVDACVAVRTAATSLFVYWHVRDDTLEHVQRAKPEGVLALRVLVVEPSWDGPRSTPRDVVVRVPAGDAIVDGVPAGAVARVAIGVATDGAFFPVAHSPSLEIAADAAWPAFATSLVRWTARGAERVSADDADAAMIAHAVARARHLPGIALRSVLP